MANHIAKPKPKPPLTEKAAQELQDAYDEGLLSPETLDQVDPNGQVGDLDDENGAG